MKSLKEAGKKRKTGLAAESTIQTKTKPIKKFTTNLIIEVEENAWQNHNRLTQQRRNGNLGKIRIGNTKRKKGSARFLATFKGFYAAHFRISTLLVQMTARKQANVNKNREQKWKWTENGKRGNLENNNHSKIQSTRKSKCRHQSRMKYNPMCMKDKK